MVKLIKKNLNCKECANILGKGKMGKWGRCEGCAKDYQES